jgi:hypothetical protein
MIETTVQLHCDGCETTYPAPAAATLNAVQIRVAAAREGWTTVGRGRHVKDLCPVCIPGVRP